VVVAGANNPHYLAIDSSHLYWAASSSYTCGSIWKIAKQP
jgi:hypothetical protein